MPIAFAPAPEDSNAPLSGYLVPIAPTTNLARKFLGTSHVSRVHAHDRLSKVRLTLLCVSSRARACDQSEIDFTLLDPQRPRPRANPHRWGFPMSKLTLMLDSAPLRNPSSMTDYAPAM